MARVGGSGLKRFKLPAFCFILRGDMKKELGINQLNVILRKALKVKVIMVDSILAGDQHNPKTLKIGYGGILTLTLEIENPKHKKVRWVNYTENCECYNYLCKGKFKDCVKLGGRGR